MTEVYLTTPSSGDTDVALSSIVQIKFDQPMDASTISTSTIIMYYSTDSIVDSIVTYNESTKIAYVTPTAYLLPSTQYTILLVGDYGGLGGGVRSVAGIGLPANYEFSFTTAPELPESSGLYVASVECWIDATGVFTTGTVCFPMDGEYDSDWEQFYVNLGITGLTIGSHTIYAHGRDSFGNWGAMQSIPFSVTSGEYQSSYTQSSYVPNYGGPALYSLTVTPTPTAGSTTVSFVGIATTRTAYWEPPADYADVVRTGYLSVTSVSPEDYDSMVPSDTPVILTFNDTIT